MPGVVPKKTYEGMNDVVRSTSSAGAHGIISDLIIMFGLPLSVE